MSSYWVVTGKGTCANALGGVKANAMEGVQRGLIRRIEEHSRPAG
jgi:hypothetical protein